MAGGTLSETRRVVQTWKHLPLTVGKSRARRGWRTSLSSPGLSSLTGSGPCLHLSWSCSTRDRLMEMLLGKGCRRRAPSGLLVPGGSGDAVRIAADQAEHSKHYERSDHPMGSPSPGQSHGHLASQDQPFSGTASRVEPSPVALCNANAIYMCYKSQEQIGRVAQHSALIGLKRLCQPVSAPTHQAQVPLQLSAG